MTEYPYLATLLGGYFHQDCYDSGESDEEIVEDFLGSSWEYQQLGTRADILRLLHEHREDLAAAVERLFQPSIETGKTNEETRAWFEKVLRVLERGAR